MKFKKFIYKIIYYSGLNYICSLFLDKKIFILMYHSISSPDNSSTLKKHLYDHISIDVKKFEEQILYLKKRGHTFISFEELDSVDLKKIKKPTVVYFDDGFKDVLLNAFPLLKKYNIPATVFVVTGILNNSHMLWTILYKEALTVANTSKSEQQSKIEDIKNKSDADRLEIMKAFDIDKYKYIYDIFMKWEDVVYLHKNGFEIGSHTISHPRLNECSTSDFKKEVIESKRDIERATGSSVSAFSFPYGRGNDDLSVDLFSLGYHYVVSRGTGLNKITGAHFHYLRNISPKPDDDLLTFKLKLYFLNIFK